MGSFATSLLPFFEWLLRTTCQASVLIVLVLAIQRVFGRWLGVRGRYWLWFLVLIRMTMPWTVPSRVSVYNLLPLSSGASAILASVAPDSMVTHESPKAEASGRSDAMARSASQNSSTAPSGLWVGPGRHRLNGGIPALLSLVWLAGICCLAGCIGASHLRLLRIVRRGRPVGDRWILDLLEDCKQRIGTRARVGVIAVDGLGSPALWGLFRPGLLLPSETLGRMDRTELRHIFLHELAHHKRHDILMGHVAGMLHVLHWFNPVVALGVRRMRADRELACDGLVLSVLAADEAPAYGRTIVRQIERMLASRPRWMPAGLSGDGIRIKQRIAMIAGPQRQTYRWSLVALVLFDLLAVAALTDGVTRPKVPVYGPARIFPTTHADKHANIVRVHLCHMETNKYLAVDGESVACDVNEPGDAGLWEARYDVDFGVRDLIVYFYSVTARKYLTRDQQGNVAANGLEPTDAARWVAWSNGAGCRIVPYPFEHFYLRPQDGRIKAAYGSDPANLWDVMQVWRVKISENPKSNPDWRRRYVPGPDWYGKRPGWPVPE